MRLETVQSAHPAPALAALDPPPVPAHVAELALGIRPARAHAVVHRRPGLEVRQRRRGHERPQLRVRRKRHGARHEQRIGVARVGLGGWPVVCWQYGGVGRVGGRGRDEARFCRVGGVGHVSVGVCRACVRLRLCCC